MNDSFWVAFGAIGTTIGSLITAIAVVIAVKQYKEPLIKRLSIKMTYAFPVGMGVDMDMICIQVANTGVRPISITNIYLNIRSQSIVLNMAQAIIPGALEPIIFPILIQPEDCVSMNINRQNLSMFLKDAIAKGQYKITDKVNILVTDKTNGSHKKSTGRTVKDLLLR